MRDPRTAAVAAERGARAAGAETWRATQEIATQSEDSCGQQRLLRRTTPAQARCNARLATHQADHGAGAHVGDEAREEALAGEVLVVLLQQRAGRVHHLHGHELQALLLEAADDLADLEGAKRNIRAKRHVVNRRVEIRVPQDEGDRLSSSRGERRHEGRESVSRVYSNVLRGTAGGLCGPFSAPLGKALSPREGRWCGKHK